MKSRLSQITAEQLGHYAKTLTANVENPDKQRESLKTQKRKLEDVLAIGYWLYRAVRRIEHNWRTEVLRGKTPYSPADAASIQGMWRQWIEPTPLCLERIRALETRGVKIRGSRQFKAIVEITKQLIAGNDAFFEDTENASRWFALTAKFRNSPREIRVDDQGRTYELTGERFVAPGSTAKDVLEAFSPIDESRTKSLGEVIASRSKNGV